MLTSATIIGFNLCQSAFAQFKHVCFFVIRLIKPFQRCSPICTAVETNSKFKVLTSFSRAGITKLWLLQQLPSNIRGVSLSGMLRKMHYNKCIKSDSVNLSSFLQKAAKKSPSSLRSLCGRYMLANTLF